MKFFTIFTWFIALAAGLAVTGCGGSSGGIGGTPVSSSGKLSLSLTDASTDSYKAVYVTIAEVRVHKSGTADENDTGWKTVATPNQTYNLLELTNGVRETLGISTLDGGHYTQMRLLLKDTPDGQTNILDKSHPHANYVILGDDTVHKLKVPSGYQSGIKLVHNFEIAENQTTELILDFDAMKSVVQAGKSGQWLLKPVIKILETVAYSIVQGVITDEGNATIGGALVSAQIYDAAAADNKDRVSVISSTISDENGTYKLFLHPDTYSIVATKGGYDISFVKITTQADMTVEQNLSLIAAQTGYLTGNALLDAKADDQHINISARMDVDIDGNLEQIEAAAAVVADGSLYGITLPVNLYDVVSSSYGYETQTDENIEIQDGNMTILDIELWP